MFAGIELKDFWIDKAKELNQATLSFLNQQITQSSTKEY